MADFFEAFAREGEKMLRGPFVDAVIREFGSTQGGLLTRADFDACAPVHRKPLRVPCHDFDVLTNPPPASGGALIALGLAAVGRGDPLTLALVAPAVAVVTVFAAAAPAWRAASTDPLTVLRSD